jgi:hypothetical protein
VSTPDQLSPTSLDWALDHISKFGDTDVFPVPFEFRAVRNSWAPIRNELVSLDLAEYRTHPSQQILMPKSRTGFRAALQLDPLDALVYAAVVYDAADSIEKYRVPARLRIVCSNRLQPSADGSLFERGAGWRVYHDRCVELARSGEFAHVLIADIADFYNQVSHHRINNVLQSAGVPIDRSKNVEAFLSRLSAKQSRGIPVGPSASIALAEASLDDADKFLMSRGITYVRYVDDFRIFCPSETEAIRAAHDLTEYLYTAHRLVLATSKTYLYTVGEFTEKELLDPAEREEQGKISKLRALLDEVLQNTGYHFDFEDLPEADLNKVTRDNLVELFGESVAKRPFHLGLIRYFLRRAKQLRTGVLRESVLENLSALAPAMKEVVEYLAVLTSPISAADTGFRILAHLGDSPVGELPFVRMWGLEYFIRRPFAALFPKLLRLAEECRDSLGVRPVALLARAHQQVQWVRSQKEKWANHSPWDRRAIIWAASILPIDERRHWCQLVKDTASDPIDRAVSVLAGGV